MKPVYVFGHKNPDIDSVCSAIALANLKTIQGLPCTPKVIGPINYGTKFVLDYFNVEHPSYLNDVKIQIKDTGYLKKIYINENDSILNTFDLMNKYNLSGIPLVDDNLHITGYITLSDMARYLVSNKRDIIETNLDTLLNTLNATVLTRFKDIFSGSVQTVTFSTEAFIREIKLNENNILVVGDRYKVVDYAINSNVQLIILTRNRTIPKSLLKKAINKKITIISSSYTSFELCNRLSLSNYIKTINNTPNPYALELTGYYDDLLKDVSKYNYSNYPIINNKKECVGVLKLNDIQKYEKKKVILVDHNNYEQSIDGLHEAEILEIIDHHNIGNIGTNSPISFICRPVGCSATIVYDEYKKARIVPDKKIAGLLLSAIISDTLLFSSPTTTSTDKKYADELANLINIDIKEYGIKMLKESSSIKGLTISELIHQDFKTYSINEKTYGIAVITTMDFDDIEKDIDKYVEKLNEMSETRYESVLIFIVDIFKKGSYVLYNDKSKKLIEDAFNIENLKEGVFIPELLSRKSQILPKLMKELEK